MRIERTQFDGNLSTGRIDPSRSNRPAPSVVDQFCSTTADLLALHAGAGGLHPAAERAQRIESLREAYQRGAIRPDPERVAAAILRYLSEPRGGNE